MIPDTSTVGAIVDLVRSGLWTRERAVDLLTEAGFVDADGILNDLAPKGQTA